MNSTVRRQMAIVTSLPVVASLKKSASRPSAPRASVGDVSVMQRLRSEHRTTKRLPVRHAGINE
jgi:hypothetical protein